MSDQALPDPATADGGAEQAGTDDDLDMHDPENYGGLSVEDNPDGEVDPTKAEEKADEPEA